MNSPCDYLAALDHAYAQAGSLRELHEAFSKKLEFPYSIGTWGRLLNRRQEPSYNQLCQIALLTGLPLPPMPLAVRIRTVKQCQVIGNKPTFALLVSDGGTISYTPNGNGKVQVQVRKPTKRRKRDRSVRVRIEPELARLVSLALLSNTDLLAVSHDAVINLAHRLLIGSYKKLDQKEN